MKNYYDLLEVSHSASQEIIEKAYKTLAKKYHPDLQDDNHKKEAEQKMKELNEAYDVISDPEKRSAYDQELQRYEQESLKYNQESQKVENKNQSQNIYHKKPQYENNNYNTQPIDTLFQEQQIQFELEKQKAIEKAYYDAYIQDLKNRGYKIKYKKTFKEHVKNIIVILILIFILFLIFQIPFVKNYFVSIYEENEIIQTIVNFFMDLIKR